MVVPFVGSDESLLDVLSHFRALISEPGDTLTIVDNRPGPREPAAAEVVRAPERQSSYFARNAGAQRGRGRWLLFLDADVRAPAGLLDRYFAETPDDATAILVGGVETTAGGDTAVARYGYLTGQLNPATAARPGREYARTANAAIRRAAFEQVGGFCDAVRSGGDADLSYRLVKAGWVLERRYEAAVEHPPRASLGALLRLFGRYGAGAEWVEQRHPEVARPARSLLGGARWLLRGSIQAGVALARGDRDRAVRCALVPATTLAFEVGRRFPNEVGTRPRSVWTRLLARFARAV